MSSISTVWMLHMQFFFIFFCNGFFICWFNYEELDIFEYIWIMSMLHIYKHSPSSIWCVVGWLEPDYFIDFSANVSHFCWCQLLCMQRSCSFRKSLSYWPSLGHMCLLFDLDQGQNGKYLHDNQCTYKLVRLSFLQPLNLFLKLVKLAQ